MNSQGRYHVTRTVVEETWVDADSLADAEQKTLDGGWTGDEGRGSRIKWQLVSATDVAEPVEQDEED